MTVAFGARTPFVGREAERGLLRQLLDEAVTGRGGLALIGGEPGIGKTRLAEEVAEEARGRGFLALTGRCRNMEGALPYLPFVEIVEEMARSFPAETLREALGDAAPDVARIVPGLRTVLEGLPPAMPALPGEGRHILFNAVRDFLGRIASDQPLLLVLDDLHWADEAALGLLEHVAARLDKMPVLVLATYRDVELALSRPLGKTVQELRRLHLAHDLLLRRLPETGVAAMLATYAPGEPPGPLVALVYGETEGNPFFVEEVARHLAAEGRLVDAAGNWASGVTIGEVEVPRSVKLVIEQRLERVSDACRQLLVSAAVAGREFSLELMEALAEGQVDAALEAIEEAERAVLVQDAPRGREAWYAFTHELVRQTLLGALSLPRRQRLHLRVAEASERIHARSLNAHVNEIAFHYCEAGNRADPMKVSHYSTLAGRQAAGQTAYADAAMHFRAALAAREGLPIDDDAAEILFDLGKACDATLQKKEAWICFQRAFDHFAGNGRVDRALEVVMFASALWYYVCADELAMVERALALVEVGTPPYGFLSVALGFALAYLGDDAGSDEAFERARALADQLGLPDLELAVLRFGMEADIYRWRPRQVVEASEEVKRRARELGKPGFGLAGLIYGAMARLAFGELAEARRDIALVRAGSERLGLGTQTHATIVWRVSTDMNAGDWAAMRANIAAGLELDPAGTHLVMHQAAEHLQTGEFERADECIDRIVARAEELERAGVTDETAFTAWVNAAVVLTTARRAGHPRNPGLARRAGEIALGWPPPVAPPMLALTHAALAQEAYADGDREPAAAQLPGFEKYRGTLFSGVVIDFYRGLCLLTLDRTDEAVEAFEVALALLSNGYRPLYANTANICAQALMTRKKPGDIERARELLGSSLAIAEELGMRPSLEKARALQASLEPARGKAAYPEGLSGREVEVLRLLARGQTNAEIAEALVISPHTVGRHVSNIFDKLGTTHRADAAAWAVRHGLAE